MVRDDLLPGGSKQRFLPELIAGAREVVYPGPAWGGAALALAYAARDAGIPATLFYAARKEVSPRQRLASAAGARIVQVRPGYLSVVRARAREYARERGARLIDWGVPAAEEMIAAEVRRIDLPEITEAWVAAGSGTMLRGIARALAGRPVYGVQVGHAITDAERRGCRIYSHPLKFEQRTAAPVPFPSCRHYDAKAWEVAQRLAKGTPLFWNVMADHA